jgi:rubrerythrin
MEINIDANLLNTLRVDPNYDQEILHQVLRIAVYDEYHAYETYRKVIETFGNQMPFTTIIEAEIKHYEELVLLAQKYNVPLPTNDWYEKIVLPSSLIECCEVGVAAEIDNIQMYDNLLLYVDEYPDIKDAIYRLQAASYNNHLPAFRQCVVSYTNQEPNLTEVYENNTQHNAVENTQMLSKVDDFRNIATKLASGKVNEQDVLKVFNSVDMASIGGVLLGGLGAMQLVKMMNDKKEEGE